MTRTLSSAQLRIVSLIIALSFVFSGVLGLLRSAIIGAIFGAGDSLDAFYAAYRLPEMLFTLVAGGALGSAFIPVYSRFSGKGDESGAVRLASATLTLITAAALILSGVALIGSDWLVRAVLIPSASAEQQALTASLMRIMLGTVAIFSASGLIMAILNANQRFLAPALAPSMNNVGLIVGAVLLSPSMGVYGLAYGAVIGAGLHLVVQIPALRALKMPFRMLPNPRTAGFGEVVLLMVPRVIGAAAVQLNFVVNTALASGMAEGSLAALSLAFSLMFVVLGVVGQSVGTAIFPTLSLYGAQGDTAGFRATLSAALRGMLFVALPATVGLVVLAPALVATLFERGSWDAADTIGTAWVLRFFALGLAAFALQEVFARAFYALRDTLTPVVVAVAGVGLNVALSLALIQVVKGAHPAEGPFGGLALANVLATAIESAVLWVLLQRRVGAFAGRAVIGALGRVAIAAGVMGVGVWAVVGLLGEVAPLVVLVLGGIIGLALFEAAALLLRLPEARSIPLALLRRVRR